MSNSTNIEPPKVQDWLQNANSSDIVILIIATVSSSFVCTIGMTELYFVVKYIRREDIRRNLLWIVLMLPITTSLATIGMFFPRSSLFLYILGICYIMLCLMMIVKLLQKLFGSRFAIVEYMRLNDLKIDLNAAPICPFSCCKCMPQLEPTENKIRFIEYLVYQTVYVRIIGEIIVMMIFLEAFKTNPFFDVANTIFVISILICIYGCEVLKKISQQKLSVYYFGSLYMVVNITQAIFTAPKVLFDTLLRYGAIEVGALNTPESRSQFLANFAYICQALLLAIFSFFILNPSKNALFDEYSTRRRESVNNMPEQSHLTRRNP